MVEIRAIVSIAEKENLVQTENTVHQNVQEMLEESIQQRMC